VAAFLIAMLVERERLSAAIHAAKAQLALDMDREVGLNRVRQGLADTCRRKGTTTAESSTTGGRCIDK